MLLLLFLIELVQMTETQFAISARLREWSASLRAQAYRAKAQAHAVMRHVRLCKEHREWCRKNAPFANTPLVLNMYGTTVPALSYANGLPFTARAQNLYGTAIAHRQDRPAPFDDLRSS
jgi:hypothetical protein